MISSVYIPSAENIAKECQITRQQQDEYAAMSQERVEEARKAGKFTAEIVPVTINDRKGSVMIDQDEFPRPETNVAALSKLRPAFLPVTIEPWIIIFNTLFMIAIFFF